MWTHVTGIETEDFLQTMYHDFTYFLKGYQINNRIVLDYQNIVLHNKYP